MATKANGKVYIAMLAVLGLFFVLLLPVSVVTEQVFSKSIAAQQAGRLQDALRDEAARLEGSAKKIAGKPELIDGMAANDTLVLADFLLDEKEKGKIDFLIVTDKSGTVLVRTRDLSRRGDQVFQTSWAGLIVRTGKSETSYGAGQNGNLYISVAEPVFRNGQFFGALYAGTTFEPDSLERFRDARLSSAAELITYSDEYGIGPTTLSEQKQKKINPGLVPEQYGTSENATTLISLGHRQYALQYLPFSFFSPRGKGGIFLLAPLVPTLHGFVISILLTLVSIGLLYGVSKALFPTVDVTRQQYRRMSILIFFLTFSFNELVMPVDFMKITKAPYVIYNSTLRFSPEATLLTRNARQKVAIRIDSGGEPINSVGAHIEYDPKKVHIESIITNNSICDSDMFLEKEVNAENGEVHITCVTTEPFEGKSGIVAELLLRPLTPDGFGFKFLPDTQVLAHDGLGTNVLRTTFPADFQVTDDQMQKTTGLPYIAITSPSHPNRQRAYRQHDITLSWSQRDSYDFAYVLDQEPVNTPTLDNTTNELSFTTTVPEDGQYYFHLAPVLNGRMGPVSHFPILIDSTPPAAPTVMASQDRVRPGEVVRFAFETPNPQEVQPTFYVKIDDGIFLPVGSKLYVPFSEPGIHTVTVRSFDFAENASETMYEITVQGKRTWFDRIRFR